MASRGARSCRACRCIDALRARLDYEQQRKLDELAPTHVGLPTGSRARIDYLDDNAPIASMRMQEVFGLAATPRIGGGAVPVTFELLSPARRPLQMTRDLASFWRNAYVEVRKDMRGRYPRHYWPENPLEGRAHAARQAARLTGGTRSANMRSCDRDYERPRAVRIRRPPGSYA